VLGAREQQPQPQTPQCEQHDKGAGDVPQQHDVQDSGVPGQRLITPAANYCDLVTAR
jgi:hypothetical protein